MVIGKGRPLIKVVTLFWKKYGKDLPVETVPRLEIVPRYTCPTPAVTVVGVTPEAIRLGRQLGLEKPTGQAVDPPQLGLVEPLVHPPPLGPIQFGRVPV